MSQSLICYQSIMQRHVRKRFQPYKRYKGLELALKSAQLERKANISAIVGHFPPARWTHHCHSSLFIERIIIIFYFIWFYHEEHYHFIIVSVTATTPEKLVGYWEPQTSSVDVCEISHMHTHHIVELHNTVSTFLSLVAIAFGTHSTIHTTSSRTPM